MIMSNNALDNSLNSQSSARKTSEQIFSKSNVNIHARYHKTFGYPVYKLDTNLQQNNPHHKWKERTKVGIYLGKFPQHGIFSMVLSLTT